MKKKDWLNFRFIISLLGHLGVSFSLLLITFNLNANSTHQMSGIKFNQFKGFEKNWKLVTVRYRKDNQELRFIYANKLAVKGLSKKNPKYPDGSIFAKVAYLAQPDPAFESSLSPSQTRRFQFMVKDSKKYKETDGWGYALFNHNGEVNSEPEKDQVLACHSCHQVVPDRDFVFSSHMNIINPVNLAGVQPFSLSFDETTPNQLPEMISKLLPKKFDKILKIKSPLTKNVFQGTLDEIKPTLGKLVVTKKLPVLFLSDSNQKFTLIYPEDLSIECDDEGAKGLFVVSINSLPESKTNKVHFCQAY